MADFLRLNPDYGPYTLTFTASRGTKSKAGVPAVVLEGVTATDSHGNQQQGDAWFNVGNPFITPPQPGIPVTISGQWQGKGSPPAWEEIQADMAPMAPPPPQHTPQGEIGPSQPSQAPTQPPLASPRPAPSVWTKGKINMAAVEALGEAMRQADAVTRNTEYKPTFEEIRSWAVTIFIAYESKIGPEGFEDQDEAVPF